ncbi:MAG: squalene/phytoene synthase family protein [Verrucomicrobiota bacterium]
MTVRDVNVNMLDHMDPHARLYREVLRDVSRSFYLTLRLLPASMQRPCALGYLLARLSDTIADTSTVPADIRLEHLTEFQRVLTTPEAAAHFQAHLLNDIESHLHHDGERALALHTSDCFSELHRFDPPFQEAIQKVLRPITRGQSSDLEHFADASPDHPQALPGAKELNTYTDEVAGCVGRFWTQLGFLTDERFAELDQTGMEALGTKYGQGLQLLNILRDLPEDLANGRCYLPEEELTAVGWEPDRSWKEQIPALKNIAHRWEAKAEAGLQAGLDYSNLLRRRRTRIATALPALIGRETLVLLRGQGEERFRSKVKITRKETRHCLKRALWLTLWNRPFQIGEIPSAMEPQTEGVPLSEGAQS